MLVAVVTSILCRKVMNNSKWHSTRVTIFGTVWLAATAFAATIRYGAFRRNCGRAFLRYGLHSTLTASQTVAGSRSEASPPGSKNAPMQSILKGCQIASYRLDSQVRACVTQDQIQLGFEGRRSKVDLYRFYLSREVIFSGIPSGCMMYGDCVPGVYASLQPPATVCDRFAIKMNASHEPAGAAMR
jgi:hypothetical protein